ncbi:MAG: ABC transporter permease [Oligoflexus sp.]
MFSRLVIHALQHRFLTSILTTISIGLSVALLLGVERVRQGSRDAFMNTIAGTDLIVGAKGGTLNLLLYSVFHMGTPIENISYQTFEAISQRQDIEWTIPISLGDSHRDYRVVGTNENFYRHYQYNSGQHLELSAGQISEDVFDIVIGSEVASQLNYHIGQQIVLSHGSGGGVSFLNHANRPFKVVGILAQTSTPIDKALYITLEGMEALHIDWQDGAPPLSGQETSNEELQASSLEVKEISAFFLRSRSRIATLHLQRWINDYSAETLMAILPGVVLSDLWQSLSYVENGLKLISLCVVVVGLFAMLIAIYNSLSERRREMAILRSLGASPSLIFSLLTIEALALTISGIVMGMALLYLSILVASPIIYREFGLNLALAYPGNLEWLYLGGILILGTALGFIPAWRAYRNTLSDGLTIRI